MPPIRKELNKMKTYKPIKRKYLDYETKEEKYAYFIASGQWADGHLAYTRLNENMERIEEEEGAYFQVRSYDGLFMERI